MQVRDYARALDDFTHRARAERHAIFMPALVQDLHRSAAPEALSIINRPFGEDPILPVHTSRPP